jgi:hypothetical protein
MTAPAHSPLTLRQIIISVLYVLAVLAFICLPQLVCGLHD